MPLNKETKPNRIDYLFFLYYSIQRYRAASTDFPDPLSQPVSIVHRSQQVIKATSLTAQGYCILLLAGRPTFARPWGGPLEYIAYELVLTSLAVSCMSTIWILHMDAD